MTGWGGAACTCGWYGFLSSVTITVATARPDLFWCRWFVAISTRKHLPCGRSFKTLGTWCSKPSRLWNARLCKAGGAGKEPTLMMKPGFMTHGTCFSCTSRPEMDWILAYFSNRACQICVALFNLSGHLGLIYSQSHKSKVPALILHQKRKAAGIFLDFTAPVGKDGVDVVYLRLCISLTPSQARKLPKVKLGCGRRDEGGREGGI